MTKADAEIRQVIENWAQAVRNKSVVVKVDQVMQWHANGYSDLIFYEICEPPYQDGRFENL